MNEYETKTHLFSGSHGFMAASYYLFCDKSSKTVLSMDEKLLKSISGNVDMDQVNLAIKRMEHNRAPLYHVDSGLYDQITDLLEEYGENNDLPEDGI